jgi:hypothetical protein
MPFSRRGSYICLANANGGSPQRGSAQLWLSTARMRRNDRNNGSIFTENHFRQIRVEIIKDGAAVEASISTSPYELILSSDIGEARFCIGDEKYLSCRSEDGIALRLTHGVDTQLLMGAPFTDLFDGSFRSSFGNYFMLFTPLAGLIRASDGPSVELLPDADGVLEVVMEEALVNPKRRERYMSYDECVSAVKADYDAFAETILPKIDGALARRAPQAAWTLWGLTSVPDGETVYRRRMIRMIRSSFEAAFSWQHGMHAVFFSSYDLKFAWELLLSCFDCQDSTGRIADSLAYDGPGDTMKPPVQGLGYLWLARRYDISIFPKDEMEFLWNGMERWTRFHLEYRDLDGDGIFENQSAGETGWEAASYFNLGFPLASPDTNAYLALQMEALADLGRRIGKDEKTCAYWENMTKQTVDKIVSMFWDSDAGCWNAVNIMTKNRAGALSAVPACTLVLGGRLPRDVVDKTVAHIFDSPGFLTPFGVASESQSSPYFNNNWCSGSIDTPIQALLLMALEDCGMHERARDLARRYLSVFDENRMMHIHDSKTGAPVDSIRFFTEETLFNSGWTAGCYIFCAHIAR